MKDDVLDCQGLACPGPVLACKRLVDEMSPAEISCLVDNEAAKENVGRYMSAQGYDVAVEANNGAWTVTGKRSGAKPRPAPPPGPATVPAGAGTLAFIDSETMGRGDDELGRKLMVNYLATLPELGESLWRIILVNAGVKLATQDSPALDHLKKLEKSGVSILVCGTCLDHFGLLQHKQVGQTTNMLDVVTSLQLAGKVLKT